MAYCASIGLYRRLRKGNTSMKRIVLAALALTLFAGAASAHPWHRHHWRHHWHHHHHM